MQQHLTIVSTSIRENPNQRSCIRRSTWLLLDIRENAIIFMSQFSGGEDLTSNNVEEIKIVVGDKINDGV